MTSQKTALLQKKNWTSNHFKKDMAFWSSFAATEFLIKGNSIIPPHLFQPHPRTSKSHKNSHPLSKCFTRTNYHRNSFRHSVVGSWNKLLDDIAKAPSNSSFKRRLRYFMKSYLFLLFVLISMFIVSASHSLLFVHFAHILPSKEDFDNSLRVDFSCCLQQTY